MASSTPSQSAEEKNVRLGLYFRILLSGKFLPIVLWRRQCERERILWQNISKSLSSSKWLASLAVGMKLRPLLRRRIWGSVRSLPDRLAMYVLAHVIHFLSVQLYVVCGECL